MDDFEVIGRIVVDSSGAMSIQNVNEELDGMEESAGGLGGVFSNVGGVISNVMGNIITMGIMRAVQALQQFIGDTIKLAEQHQQTMAQFNAVLANSSALSQDANMKNAAAISMTKDQLLALADQLSRTTTYSEDAQVAAETVLLQFGKIGKDVFPQAMQASEDLATRLGTDLPNAATMVAKALGDPAAGIGRLNQAYKLFEPAQLKMIENLAKTGHTAEAQTMILDALNQKIGGASAAAADTFAGKLAIMNNKMDEFKIKIGDALLPVLSNMLTELSPIADKVLPVIANVLTQQIIPAIERFAGGVGDLISKVMASKDPLGTFVSMIIQDYINWISQVPGQIAAFINTIVTLIQTTAPAIGAWITNAAGFVVKNWPVFAAALGTILTNIITWIETTASQFLNGAQKWLSQAAAAIHAAWPFISNALDAIFTAVVTWIDNTTTAFLTGAQKWLSQAAQAISTAWPFISAALSTILTNIGTWISDGVGKFKDAAGQWLGAIGTWISTRGWPALVSAFTGLMDSITAFFTGDGANKAQNGFSDLLNKVATWISSSGWPALENGFIALVADLGDFLNSDGVQKIVHSFETMILAAATWLISNAWKTLKASFDGIMANITAWFDTNIQGFINGAKSWIDGIVTGIKNTVQNVVTEINTDVNGWITTIQGFVNQFITAGEDLIEGLVQGIKNKAQEVAAQAVITVVNAVNAAKAALGIHSPSKVFLEMGYMIPQGLALGIQQMANLPNAAANNMVGGVLGTMNGGNTNNNSTITQIYNFGANLYGQGGSPQSSLTQAFRK